MRKNDFIKVLNRSLKRVENEERKRCIDYYQEMIDDRIEAGMTEEQAVSECGDVKKIAEQLIAEAKQNGQIKKKRSPLAIILICIGFPLWFSLGLAFFAIILALYIIIWAVLIALYVVDLALVLAGFVCFGASIVYMPSNMPIAVLAMGIAMLCSALAVLLFLALWMLSKLVVKLCALPFKIMKKRRAKRRGEVI